MNLTDISYSPSVNSGGPQWEIVQKKMAQIIQSLSNKKASEATDMPNSFLKAMSPQLMAALILITQICLDWKYYSQIFKTVFTVALQKPEKNDYQMPSSWWLITLLKILEKMIETVIAVCIQNCAESMNLLPEAQMRV